MDPFLKVCGATSRLRWSLERQSPAVVEVVDLDQPYTLIGRDARADLRLDHPAVCERHAYLQVVGGRLFCVDLGSRLGTSLGGTRRPSAWVGLGQAVRIGPYRVRLIAGIDEAPDGDREAGDIESEPESPLALELSHRGVRPSLCRTRSALTLIGSAADCQVRLLDPSVANYHCSLLHTPGGVWVVDLLGEGGVTVNGVAESCAGVDDGDEIRVGHSVIRVWREAAVSTREGRRVAENGQAPVESRKEMVGVSAAPHIDTAEEPVIADAGGSDEADAAESPTSVVPALSETASAIGQVPALRAFLAGQPPEQAALVESIVMPLVEHFGRMQQGLFEEFRDARDAMFRMCTEIQQEQADTIERELDQIRGVARELKSLRDDLADRLRALDERAGRVDSEKTPGPVIVRLGSATPLSALNGSACSRRGRRLDPDERPDGNPVDDGLAALGRGFAPGPKQERPPHEDIHAALCERIESARREQRRSPWRRIVDRVQGPSRVGTAR